MNRMRKFVSPRVKHKVLDAPNKTFGVPLDELVRQVPPEGDAIPTAVKKICEHIYKHGVDQEGIFRVSGSARIVEKLKASFNLSGDADLDGENDIMAVAGLLKLFLRELPDSLIPEHLTQEFIAIQTGMSNKQDYILRLRSRLNSLPEENYVLLKYIVCFLVAVSSHHDVNKMGPMALAIVFGPNIFRCGDGIAGLKDQGTINVLVSQFITEYNQLFREDDEVEPVETWKQKTRKTPPPRPPPPQVVTSAPSVTPVPEPVEDFRPVPAPRKGQYDSSQYQDGETDDNDKSEVTVNSRTSSNQFHSPHFSDEESHGRGSPFVLESESLSIIESPMVTARTSELVERTIFDTITEQLFGSDQTSARDSPLPSKSQEIEVEDHSTLDDLASSVRAKVELFERRSSQPDCLTISGLLKKEFNTESDPLNKDFVRNYDQIGDQIGGGGGDFASEMKSLEGSFDDLHRDSEMLGSMKKDGGPRRRSPSIRFRHNSLEKKELDTELTELLEETAIVVTDGNFQTHRWTKTSALVISDGDSDEGEVEKEDINHNHHFKSVSMGFMNIHENQENEPLGDTPSPEKSPLSKHRPMIPPLDLSTLHQNVDGTAAVLASNTQTVAWDKKLKVPAEEMNGVPSPRVSKLKKRNGMDNNTDIPPSPPRHQDQYQKQMIDEEYSHRLKQLTKKIQGLKKKVRTFEDEFERDHGYKPSQGEKAARPEVKKYMTELSRTRKDLKKLREECERGNRSRHGSGASSSGDGLDFPRVEDTLQMIMISLREKRQDASRPEDLTLMTKDQVQEEKLAVQKALLHFESLHGRPNSKEDKDLMRPLYDRYRAIKRMLAKPMSPRNSLELPPVPEDQMMEIPSGTPTTTLFQRKIVHVPTAEEEEDEGEDKLGTMDFAVTRDLSLLRGTMFPSASSRQGTVQPKVRKKEVEVDQEISTESNLHELGIHELHTELESSRGEKKRLRHHLREFEKGFHEKHGRKVQKEDRAPMQDSYNQYKQVKARLRLLEALVLKHHE
ncbi:protein FAM13A-like [Babylonia areolata]|uniref:protein FAM13A-like n=1 Tax=Babylonia areolata TaxID=304850 RepID=UPI003FD084EE